jgi:hypothetical protein
MCLRNSNFLRKDKKGEEKGRNEKIRKVKRREEMKR